MTSYDPLAPAYSTIHNRLRRVRGPASAHACHQCGQPATQWSCVGPKTHAGTASGDAVRYSILLEDYRPACARCNMLADRTSTLPLGVTFFRGRYRAQFKRDGVTRYLGTFSTPDEAHAAYEAARRETRS